MEKKRLAMLSAGIAIALLVVLGTAAFASYSQTTSWPSIQYTGVNTDRGIAVNKNPGSPYYGYLYVCDGTAGARTVRELRPDPASNGTSGTSYVETGATFGAPGGDLINDVFVGSDDTVWLPNYSQKKVYSGNPANHTTTLQFSTTQAPRAIWVTGKLGVAGTKAYVAESTWASPAFLDLCEIYQFDGTAWHVVATLDSLGVSHPYAVTVDKAGNSYWLANSATNPYIVKVGADYSIDWDWSFVRPAWDFGTFLPSDIEYVSDPLNPDNQEYLYVVWGSGASGVERITTNGQYIDGFGQTYGTYDPPANWQGIEMSTPGSNNPYFLTVDDQHNVYMLNAQYNWAVWPNGSYVPGIIKVHNTIVCAPNAPTNVTASNDVYGQIKLTWDNAVPANTDSPVTGYRVYRSTDTTKPDTSYTDLPDLCTKWKDAAQGQTAGGPFYYWVSALSGTFEGPAAGPIGPKAPSASTAPAPRSLNAALGYSEVSATDTVECRNLAAILQGIQQWLDKRSVNYTLMYDRDATKPNVENDDIAGHTLLILPMNRDMSSYEAQCIKDYVKYSHGRVWSGYYNSAGMLPDFRDSSTFQLADVYRADLSGWQTSASFSAPWDLSTFRYMRPDPAVIATIPNGSQLFAGLPDGVVQPGANTISMIVTPYSDGTAKAAGIWDAGNGTTPYGAGDPKNAALVIGSDAQGNIISLYTSLLWWMRTPEFSLDNTGSGTFSASKFTENVLAFFGVPFTAQPNVGDNLGSSKVDLGDGTRVACSGLVVSQTLYNASTGLNVLYAQTSNRSSGIKVVLPQTMSPTFAAGDIVDVSGMIGSESESYTDGTGAAATTWGDRIIKAVEIIKTGADDAPKSLYMANKNVVGPWSTNWHQNGAWVGGGVNNLGLYIAVAGNVTYIEESGGSVKYFYVDDGSNLTDGTTHDNAGTAEPNVGLRIVAPSWLTNQAPTGFAVGKSVSITGCSALELVGLGGDNGVPAVRIAGMDHVVVNN